VTGPPGGFDVLSGAGDPVAAVTPPPEGIRTISAQPETTTRVVMIRHGEAVCNVSGVCGGRLRCEGLTPRGRRQVEGLRDRLLATGELVGADVLYASWNGATEIARWSVLGGPGAQELSPLGVAPRAGFETAITVPRPPAYLAVEALDGAGTVLGRSVAHPG